MKTKYLVVLITLIILIIVGGTAGYFIWQSQKPVKIKVVEMESLSYPFWVAEEKGYLKDKNIEIEEVTFPDLNNKDFNTSRKNFRKWFSNGGADVAVLSTDDFFNMEIEYPGSVKAFVFFSDTKENYSASLIVGKDSDINSVADLEKKKIAADVSDVDQFLLAHFLKKSGIKDFQPLKISRSSWSEFLEQKKADAVWATEPQSSQMINKGIGKKLVENPNNNPESEASGAITNVIVMKTDFVNKYKKVVESFRQAFDKTLEVDENEIREIATKHLGKDWEEVVKIRTYSKMQSSSQVNKALFQKLADMMFEEKYISKKVDTSKLFY